LLKDLRSKPAPVIVCTAGDFYGSADVFNEAKSHFVAAMMGEMGYDAVGIGEQELNFGLAALVRDAREYGLPVVCANLVARADSLRIRYGGPADKAADRMGTAFPPYVVVERAGVRFGFAGVVSPATKLAPRPGEPAPVVEGLTYTMGDPLAALREVAPELRKACDVMVVLAHMGEDEAKAMAAQIEGIDFVVLGHGAQDGALGDPIVAGATTLLRATSQGQYIGELSITFGEGNRVAATRNRIHPLSAAYPDDPEMALRLDGFDEENRKLQKELYAREQLKQADGGAGAGRYVGVGTCQSCHIEEFEVYIKTAHATAYATLSSQFVHRDTNCVGCHVTGWGDTGGFAGVRARGALVDLVDVQCEACHGPGSDHARDGSYRQRAIDSCVTCHTESDDPDFDYEKDWPPVAH
jgi:hypothetical protein